MDKKDFSIRTRSDGRRRGSPDIEPGNEDIAGSKTSATAQMRVESVRFQERKAI